MNNKLTDELVSNATLIRLIQWAEQHNSHYVAAALRELQERRKADSAEPAGYHVIKECGKVGCSVATLEEAEKTRDFWNKKWIIRPYFYSAAPAPVVPEKMNFSTACNFVQINGMAKEDRATLAMRAWNACRTAMLQGGEPVSQTYNLPELIVGMEVSVDVSTCDADAGNRYFGTVTEVSELDSAKNGYILLVQDAKPNFDVNGNSPVTPDGLCPCCGRKPLKHIKCSVPGCVRKHVAHGLCQRHYDMKRREDPEQVEKFREANRRFTAKKRAQKAAVQKQEVK